MFLTITLCGSIYERLVFSIFLILPFIKVGFTLEGILKKDIYFKDKMINRCMYGICKDEWRIDNEYINN